MNSARLSCVAYSGPCGDGDGDGADDQADHDDRKRAPDPDQYFQLSRHELHRISPSSAPHPGSMPPP